MIARILRGAVLCIEGYLVEVEVNLAPGVPNFSIVGLPDAAAVERSRPLERLVGHRYYFGGRVRKICPNQLP